MGELNSNIVSILYKVAKGETLSASETKDLESWIAKSPHNKDVYDSVVDGNFEWQIKQFLETSDSDEAWERLSPRIKKGKTSFLRKPWVRYAAAASIFLVLSTTIYLLFLQPSGKKPADLTKTTTPVNNDIAPGTSYATLTLADGSVVQLNGNTAGVLRTEGDTKIIGSEGMVSYSASTIAGTTPSLQYNTLSIGRQAEYELMLSDGSRVWLNASTRLRYPVAFAGNERVVYVTGEAFFKVAKDASRPFRVVVEPIGNKKGSTLTVLGTEFNVKSYAEEPEDVSFTLVEGSVRVSHENKESLLKPNEQIRVEEGGNISLNHPNVESVIAWKNKKFFFKKTPIKSILWQISRWYDIDVKYATEPSAESRFTGVIGRQVNLSETLNMLREGGINFEFDAKTKTLTFKSVTE